MATGVTGKPLAISIACPPNYLSLEEYDINHVNSIRTAFDITKLILNFLRRDEL